MKISRDIYLEKLIKKKKNGLIKVVTGLRRCGKSYLLFRLFHDHLVGSGIPKDHIIEIALDECDNKVLRNPDVILRFIKDKIRDEEDYFIIIDEVQYLEEFEDVLNRLQHIPNADVYVTGSNARRLSSDVITEFRGRGDEIHVYPLSFAEFQPAYQGPQDEALDDYLVYGGMPHILTMQEDEDKAEYLASLFQNVYIPDIVERYNIRNKAELDSLANVLATLTGTYTNQNQLVQAFKRATNKAVGEKKIKSYTDCLADSYLVSRAERYDIKRRKCIGQPSKYYFEDTGLMNARLGFLQSKETHLIENIIYNELRVRGYTANTGMVLCYETRDGGKKSKKQQEVDFVAVRGSEKCYIQYALSLSHTDKVQQKRSVLSRIPGSFRKIIVVRDNIKFRRDENGITTIGLKNFLLNKNSMML